MQVPACLCNTLTPFLTTFGSSFGPWELLKKKTTKSQDIFVGYLKLKLTVENRQSYELPGCLGNILPPFLSTCGRSTCVPLQYFDTFFEYFWSFGVAKKENYKISGYLFWVFEVKERSKIVKVMNYLVALAIFCHLF